MDVKYAILQTRVASLDEGGNDSLNMHYEYSICIICLHFMFNLFNPMPRNMFTLVNE
jgi:hypothetical protein